jgi:D-alanyl-D-alanine carboxypeptidase
MKLYKHTGREAVKRALTFLLVLIVGYAAFIYITQPYIFRPPVTPAEHQSQPASTEQPAPAVMVRLPGASPFLALKQDYTQPSSTWALVNKTRAIPLSYVPNNLTLPEVATRSDKSIEERSVRVTIKEPLENLFAAAAANGHQLLVGSAYRSANLQKIYFDHYALVAGEAAANRYSAHPGESEHQTGLSVDLSSTSLNCYLEECFSDTEDGRWLATNAHTYGFILRYPKGKENVTGYQFEPWHFRYVGVDLASALYRSGLTLEQAWPYLEVARRALDQNGSI